MTIYQRIILLRHTEKLTQPVFAEKISISKGYIAALELGKKPVNDRIIKLICSVFKVNEDWLRNGVEPMYLTGHEDKVEDAMSLFRRLNTFFQDYFISEMQKIYEYEKGRKL
ncbi:MAG: helix-turn-helix domain-containing protein [Treponema sp.]|jgi:transcriptional regulator with XRE-family HTH domain|nr:helix-turn-helix domain-containing protein [Treponema sp.]